MTNFMTKLMLTARKAKMKQKTNNKTVKGFTLVELIVVLVILAILAATLIPALTGYIDKANQKAAISECRSCVSAIQTIASEAYATGGAAGAAAVADTDDKIAAIKALAEVEGTFGADDLTVTNGKVAKLVYKAANETVVTYDTTADQLYTIGASAVNENPET